MPKHDRTSNQDEAVGREPAERPSSDGDNPTSQAADAEHSQAASELPTEDSQAAGEPPAEAAGHDAADGAAGEGTEPASFADTFFWRSAVHDGPAVPWRSLFD